MDRNIVYPGAIPLDTDALTPQVDSMVALGWLLQSVMGTNTGVVGLPCAPTSPASMVVNVGPGAIWSLEEIDTTAFGSLAADTSNIMKMGINKEAVGTNFTLTAPGTSGDSINYLIEATFSETDGSPVVLPYYNSANPTQPYSGPNNSGTAQNTVRTQSVALQLKAGAAAPTGTQTTPAVDGGYVGLYVITVAYGASSVTAGNIAVYSDAPFVAGINSATAGIQSGRLLAIQIFTSSGTYKPTPGTTVSYQHCYGAGGGAGGAPATYSSQASVGGGGGSGAYTWKKVTNPTSQSVTVGSGGAGGTGAVGTAGGATSIGTYLSAGGGGGGGIAGPASNTGTNFTAIAGSGGSVLVAGDFTAPGMLGNPGQVVATSTGAMGIFSKGTPGMFMYGHGYGGGPNSLPASQPAATGEGGSAGVCICFDFA